jgi:hypothetical protein
MRKIILVVLMTLLVAASAFAVDGVVLINQSTVTAAGGFPYVISQPGSYKLTGNLAVPMDTQAIQVNVSNVTLDLNGFSITTPISASVFPPPAIRSNAGIDSFSLRNGAIQGFPNPISPGDANRLWSVQDMTFLWGRPGSVGSFGLGSFAKVSRISSLDIAVNVQCPSVVTESAMYTVNVNFINPGSGKCSFTNNAVLF